MPFESYYSLTTSDKIRKHIIFDLISNNFVDYKEYEALYGIQISIYFAKELQIIKSQYNKFITFSKGSLKINNSGVSLFRNIALTFDAYNRDVEYSIVGP